MKRVPSLVLVAWVGLLASPAWAAPRQIHLDWHGDTATTMTVVWRDASSQGTVAYGENASYDGQVASESIAFGGDYLHAATLTGLAPGTTYHYAVGTTGDLSPDRTFTTAPPVGTPFRFVAWGDSRSDPAARRRVRAAVEARAPAFSVFSGDLVGDGTSQAKWDQWFEDMEPLAAVSPIMPAIGNHENGSPLYYAQFVLPAGAAGVSGYAPESWYSFDYAGVHFVSLSTEPVGTADGPEAKWLAADLAAASEDPSVHWIVAYGHRPPFSSGNHGSWAPTRDVFLPILEAYDVDVAFWGHDHDYERTWPMRGGQRNDAAGITHYVSGGAGAPLYSVGSSAFTAYSEKTYNFVEVTVDGGTMTLEGRDETGAVFDRLVLQKDLGGEADGGTPDGSTGDVDGGVPDAGTGDVDGGTPDAGTGAVDGGAFPDTGAEAGGCACGATGAAGPAALLLLIAGLVVGRRRR